MGRKYHEFNFKLKFKHGMPPKKLIGTPIKMNKNVGQFVSSVISYPQHVTDIVAAIKNLSEMNFDRIIIEVTNTNFYNRDLYSVEHRKFTRCDMYLKPVDWHKKVIFKVASGIECDPRSNDNIKKHSRDIITQELGWAKHLQHPISVLMPLVDIKDDDLIRQILVHAGKSGMVLIEVPIIDERFYLEKYTRSIDRIDKATASTMAWQRWNMFNASCGFPLNFKIALELTTDVPDANELKRWFSEPVVLLIMSPDLFTIRDGRMVLLQTIELICLEFVKRNRVDFAIKSARDDQAVNMLAALKRTFEMVEDLPHGCNGDSYMIKLAVDRDDLFNKKLCTFFTSTTLEKYKEAILLAIEDLVKDKGDQQINLLICGKNSIDLLQSVWMSVAKFNRVKVFVHEVNVIIRETIHAMAEDSKVETDIAVLPDDNQSEHFAKMHIVVSVCNESIHQSQWLDVNFSQVSNYATHDAIMIPNRSTLYVRPVMSSRIHSEVLGERYQYYYHNVPKYHDAELRKESFRITCMRHLTECADETQLFEFKYSVGKSNLLVRRWKKLHFVAQQECMLTRFAAYFEADLYGDVKIDSRGLNDGSCNCIPVVYLPLVDPQMAERGADIEATFWLMFDEMNKQFWYEWCTLTPQITRIHNAKGFSSNFGYRDLSE